MDMSSELTSKESMINHPSPGGKEHQKVVPTHPTEEAPVFWTPQIQLGLTQQDGPSLKMTALQSAFVVHGTTFGCF